VIDIITFATFLSPFLPYLSMATDKAVESAASKFGEAGWKKAQDIWGELSPKVAAKPAALEAVADVIDNPKDAAYQTVLQVQLKKLLDQDPDLAKAIEQIIAAELDGIPGAQVIQNVIGNQVIGQDYGTAIMNVQGDVKL
jgi:hypothetical protein